MIRLCKVDFLAAMILLLLRSCDSFGPSQQSSHGRSRMVQPPQMAPRDGQAGSFFHKVPGDDDDDDTGEIDMDEAINKLIKKRKGAPRAAQPSTINGVPTSETGTGFGKPPNKNISDDEMKSSKPYIPIGPPDTPQINNPSKPEFDDQGYTLYTDKETGKKSRVFEALVEYPCDFTMKIVGANEGSFVSDMVGIVAEACEATPDDIQHSVRAMGKWTSVSVEAPVKSAEMLYALYEKLDLDPRVRFKF